MERQEPVNYERINLNATLLCHVSTSYVTRNISYVLEICNAGMRFKQKYLIINTNRNRKLMVNTGIMVRKDIGLCMKNRISFSLTA
jgi:hypothetical protein